MMLALEEMRGSIEQVVVAVEGGEVLVVVLVVVLALQVLVVGVVLVVVLALKVLVVVLVVALVVVLVLALVHLRHRLAIHSWRAFEVDKLLRTLQEL